MTKHITKTTKYKINDKAFCTFYKCFVILTERWDKPNTSQRIAWKSYTVEDPSVKLVVREEDLQ